MAHFQVIQPETTYTNTPIQPLQKGLPRRTQSLCPDCTQLIDATIFEDVGKVVMEKCCASHGDFRDIISSDARLYLKMEEWTFGDNRGLDNPAVTDATRCPEDCGLCNLHTSHTGLANVDLTNRCNLTCPVCFANANVAGYVYEPDFETVRRMLQALRDERPVAGRIVQFSGGEPTIYPRFLDVLRVAREMGFSHTQVATNGIRFTDLEFAEQSKEAGLHTLYLQFDGVCDDIYRRTRGESLWEQKLQAIENVRRAGLKIAHHRQGLQRPPDRRHHPARPGIHRVLQRDQLPAGVFHRAHLAPRARGQTFHSGRLRARGAAADRHRRPVRGLVPAELRHALFQAGERLARRRDYSVELSSALLARDLFIRGSEPPRGPGDAVRRRRSHAPADGPPVAQGR